MSWVADYPDPETFGAALVETGSSMNTGYSSGQVDRLVGDTRRLADRSRTVDAFGSLQGRVSHDVPLIPLWQRKEYVVSTSYVGGGQYLQDGTGVFRLVSRHLLADRAGSSKANAACTTAAGPALST